MRRITVYNCNEAKEIIQAEIRHTEQARLHHRLHCVLLICHGKTCAEVSALFGDSLRAVQYWVNRFNEAGIEGLRDTAHPGRHSRLSTEDKKILAQDLRCSPHKFGYSQNIWDGKLMSHHLQQKFKVEMKVRQCQYLFYQLGFRRRKPRPVIAKANLEAQQTYKKT